VALLALLGAPATALAGQARASLTDIENDVMCVACHEPLAVAESPQADSERNYILMLIRRGETKAEIERELVAQYGPSVLGKPPAQGFSLSLYILPPALVVIGLLILAVTLPRWRRRTRAIQAASPGPEGSATPAAGGANGSLALSSKEAQRLDDELTRYGG
jgi:cytochrome c-type biogenesis protein CcmH